MINTLVGYFSALCRLHGRICHREEGQRQTRREGSRTTHFSPPTPIHFSVSLMPGRKPFILFLLNHAFDSVSSGKSLTVAHLWLLCEGLNYLQTALKSLDERHCISAKYCYSDMEFNDPLQFIRKCTLQ